MEESVIKRTLPNHEEAERSVVSVMLYDKDTIPKVSEILTADDFFQRQYGLLFQAMVELYNSGISVDPITLQNKLREMQVPPEISDTGYLISIMDSSISAVNVEDYARIVAEKSMLRKLIRAAEEVENSCYVDNQPLDQLMDESEKKMFQIFQQKSGNDDFVPIKTVVMKALETIEKASKTSGNVTGLATGFTDLDYRTSGLQPSDLILVAARPSMGKTAFVLNIAEYMAFRKNRHVAIFSLEMSKQQLVNRLFAMESHVSAQALRNGNLKDDDWKKLIESAGVIGESNLIIDDTPGITVRELRSKCRKYQLEHGLDIVMIDYLQLMSGSGSRNSDSRQQEISEISRSLKGLARELNVPVIALSQLSRAVESRPDHRPMLSDLRESGAIEQDADVVMFLYRDDYYNKDSENKGICEIIIAKQRQGPIGTIDLAWLPEYTKFVNAEPRNRQEG